MDCRIKSGNDEGDERVLTELPNRQFEGKFTTWSVSLLATEGRPGANSFPGLLKVLESFLKGPRS
ncbi:hypothetical protein CHH27_14185 [Labrenzia sp. VG12]|nr:hypothetical protein CHH27_14185 [Labrenzia sp. VG12]